MILLSDVDKITQARQAFQTAFEFYERSKHIINGSLYYQGYSGKDISSDLLPKIKDICISHYHNECCVQIGNLLSLNVDTKELEEKLK